MTAIRTGILGRIGMERVSRLVDEWDVKPALAVALVAPMTLLLDKLKDPMQLRAESALADRTWNEPAQAEEI